MGVKSMGDGTGVAVKLAMAAAGEDFDEAAPELDLGLPAPRSAAGRALVEERRRGRPPGARNKRTAATVERLLARHEDPRAVLLAIAETPVDELVACLGCKPLEAVQEKRLAALGVLPYIASRQPLAIDLTNHRVINLTIVEGEATAAPILDHGEDEAVVKVVENQCIDHDGESDV